MSKLMRAIGLMSGTSLDGIDAAFLETDGEDIVIRGPARTYPYDDGMRRLLLTAIADAGGLISRAERPHALAEAEQALTEYHARAVAQYLADVEIDPAAIDVIGFHGQTVLHRPEARLTVQLGRGDLLAHMTGCPVVYDLRAADVAAGGQGAPLVPVYHRALTAKLPHRPVAVVNIGGVANVTWIGRDGSLIAFDTGPGNAMLDDWMARKTGAYLDAGGATAAQGLADEEIVRRFLSHAYFNAPPPKSLDRNMFSSDLIENLSAEDGAATLAAFTARAIAKAREHMPVEPELWIVAGGGRKNRAIMRMLAEQVHNAVVPAETVEFDGDAMEAEAWAYLAVRSIRELPITYPGTTGVPAPMSGGVHAGPTAYFVR
ncbi:anhydro-N-acetylmuramic acid kinase [Hyphomicrobium sp.]|uniref:anhydro-N-acetylmuramic acid kinase n=1 Tax=Hyphomicrobium sp. TaxID=82 RepID=UPI002D78080E|nr:anhydro-N-acetylmuramic acid kinase [Hyphomicrobium sp.]HET6389986.1 anhydro-N-acetylmuramic acid kinase [Hyphomicrobium sp.]